MSMTWTTTIDWSSDDAILKKQLLSLTRPRLIRLCKLKKVPHWGFKNDVIDRLMHNNNAKNSPQQGNNNRNKLNTKKPSNTFIKISKPQIDEKIPELESPLTPQSPPIPNSPLTPQSPPLPNSPIVITNINVNLKEPEFDMKQQDHHHKKSKKKHRMKIIFDKQHRKPGSYIWILDKNRKLRSIASPIPIGTPHSRRLSLTNSHNFLWITSILKGTVHVAEIESEITMASLDRILSLLPINYRLKIWEIINEDQDIYIVNEDYAEFVDCLLIATGQKYDMDDISMEIRDMSPVFNKIVNIEEIFGVKGYITNAISKSGASLSVNGARRVILSLRNMKEEDGHKIKIENDLALPILTGLTKKALVHSVAYCTRSYWKILTDVFWDEEDEKDLALCTPIDHYSNIATMEDLFGELHCEMGYDLAHVFEEVQESTHQIDLLELDQHLNV